MTWLLLSDDELRARLEQRGVRDVNAAELVRGRDQPRIADHITHLLDENDDNQPELFDSEPQREVQTVHLRDGVL